MAQPGAIFQKDILVIDDDEILRALFSDWLQQAGYRVRSSPNVAAALKALEEAPARLIVSDMYMPGACGVDAIAALKARAPLTPLIALSGRFDSGAGLGAKEALDAGAARALPKPVRRAYFLGAVAELIGLPSAQAANSATGYIQRFA
ncbi:MAG TPA: response regulator [Burkholderiales bacterium]|nr:response regulator [Burkholderiales bacterium]